MKYGEGTMQPASKVGSFGGSHTIHSSSQEIRTRFAPSPTGYLHVGGIRTALFAWLVARQGQGKFILRLEDTDQAREVKNSESHIVDSLQALGLNYNEGPGIDGPYGPYKQSERLDYYQTWAQKLIKSGRAYNDPYSPQEVQIFRDQAQKDKKPFLYRNHRPEKTTAWNGSQPLRFKSEPKDYSWHDAVMGELHTVPEVIDDFILIKSDGFPTYNFAHIVDDSEMKISHVIRGQEFLPSIPNYLNLYEALDIKPPIMATMPHILGPDGHKKLSKRDGAKDVLDYINEGFLTESLLSFIATLGWNDGTEQEIFTVNELIKKFSLSKVQKSGARFDNQRLAWVNGAFIRKMSIDELYDKAKNFLPPQADEYDDSYKKSVINLTQERLKFFSELPILTKFFFTDLPIDSNLISSHKQLGKMPKEDLITLLDKSRKSLNQSNFTTEDLTARLNELLIQTNQKPAVLFSLLRIATTQAPASPGLAETMAILGKECSLKRITQQIEIL